MNNYNPCWVCGEDFTDEEWLNRHSTHEGYDCHEECCPVCLEEQTLALFEVSPKELPKP